MTKKFLGILTILVIIAGVSVNLALAKNDKVAEDPSTDSGQVIPEENGTYDVPGHPELKVRVFVHKVGAGKPAPIPMWQCGLSDPNSTFIVSGAGWKLPENFIYNLNLNNVPALVGSANWPLIAENSFNVWENEISKKVNVTRGADTTVARKGLDGKNIVAWGSASGSTLGVTYIWYYPSSGAVVELDTIMNTKFVWTWSGGTSTCAYTNSYDAQSILTHELGHWFGLDDEYTLDYKNNTMYGYGSKGDAKADTLTTGDIDGAKDIYNSFK